MGGKSKAPPPPDYSGVTAASEKAAELSYKASSEQLQWAKDQYASDKQVTDRVVADALQTSQEQRDAAAKDRARYESVYQPLEDNLVSEAKSYASDERKDLEMGKAQSAVAQQGEAARQNAMQQLEGYGINPASTRYGAMDLGARTAQAAAAAAAGTNASANVDNTARALRSEALNIGKGYPGQISQAYAGSVNAGNSAGQNTNAASQTAGQNMGTPTQWMGAGNQAIGTWGNTLNMGYQNALGAFNANQKASSGIGSALGLVGGIGMKMMGFEEGGDVPDQQGALPIGAPQQGGAIPVQASPSGGQAVDDVKASLTAGEFVIPKDVAEWLGEEKLQKMIEDARKKRSGASAKGEMKPALPGPETFVSRSGGALPIGAAA